MSFQGFAKGLGKAITKIGDDVSSGINKIVDGKYAGKALHTAYDKIVRPTGKAGFNISLKVGASGLKTTANVVDHVRNNADNYKEAGKSILRFGKKVGGDALKEGNELVHAGFGAFEMLERMKLIENTGGDLGKSLIGYKLTPGGKALAMGVALGAGAISSGKDYLNNRQGRHDGQTHGITPSMVNPYQISQQIAYSQTGRSYADNAGADMDLVRALSNMR